MSSSSILAWRSLEVSSDLLNLATTLSSGQCFNWTLVSDSVWSAVLHLRPLPPFSVEVRQFPNPAFRLADDRPALSSDHALLLLRQYFRLDQDLDSLQRHWANSDQRFHAVLGKVRGLRLLRQDPVETLFSFLCSSNNNIARIEQMLRKLRTHLGKEIEIGSGKFALPSVEELAMTKDEKLREIGFGYRAKFVVQTAQRLTEMAKLKYGEQGMEYRLLEEIRESQSTRNEVQQWLMQFPGIGRKVADCIALFALERLDVVPVDTHVWRIACRDYGFVEKEMQHKSITPKMYEKVGELFRCIHGPYAGWAHSFLFKAELPGTRSSEPIKRKPQNQLQEFRAVKPRTTNNSLSISKGKPIF